MVYWRHGNLYRPDVISSEFHLNVCHYVLVQLSTILKLPKMRANFFYHWKLFYAASKGLKE